MNRTVYLNKKASELVKGLSERDGITINAAINKLICTHLKSEQNAKGVTDHKKENVPNKALNKPKNVAVNNRVRLSDFGI